LPVFHLMVEMLEIRLPHFFSKSGHSHHHEFIMLIGNDFKCWLQFTHHIYYLLAFCIVFK
jgi:hypothetical protein